MAKQFGPLPFLIFLLILAASPFWYASVSTGARMGCMLAFLLVAGLMMMRHAVTGEGFLLPLATLRVPLLCFAVVALWVLVQIYVPVSASAGDPVWQLAGQALQVKVASRISAAPADSFLALASLAGVFLVFVIAFQLGAEPLRAVIALRAIAWIACLYALWGLLDHMAGWNMVLFESKNPYSVLSLRGYVASTFRNPDHFADLCVIGLACAMSLAVRDARRLADRLQLGPTEYGDVLPVAQNCLIFLVLVIAIWLSRSRGGMAAALVAVLTGALIVAIRLRRAGNNRLFLAILAGSALAALALVLLGLESQTGSQRFSTLDVAVGLRWTLYRLVVAAISDNAMLGTGFGAFRDAFSVYRTSELGYGSYWNAAHNVYLEAVLGLGIPVAMGQFTGIGWVAVRVFAGAIHRRQHVVAPIAAAAASAGLLVHGMVDFSVQVPAIAWLTAALLGFGCAQSWSSQKTG